MSVLLKPTAIFLLSTSLLTACGGSSSGKTPEVTAPAIPVVSVSGANTLTVTWADVPAAAYYQLYERIDADAAFQPVGAAVNAGIQTLTLSGLDMSERFDPRYRLASCTSAGRCVESEPVALPLQAATPALSIVNNTSATISWNHQPSAAYYQLQERDDAPDAPLSNVGSPVPAGTQSITFSNAGIFAIASKRYVLRTCNAINECVASPEARLAVTEATPDITITAADTLTVTWADVLGGVTYQLFNGTQPLGSPVNAGAQSLTLTLPVFSQGQAQFVLKSCDAAGRCLESPAVQLTGALPTITIPADNTLSVTWADVPGAAYYQLYERSTPEADWQPVGNTVNAGVQSLTINPDFAGLVLPQYQLRSCDAQHNCLSSANVALPVRAAMPSVAVTGIKTLTFRWNNEPGAAYYQLYERPDPQSGFVALSEKLNAGTLQHRVEISLHWRVQASYLLKSCDAAGQCAESGAISVSNLNDAVGYIKPSDLIKDDGESDTGFFNVRGSFTPAFNQDATRMAIGVPRKAVGVQAERGAVYVYNKINGQWQESQQLLRPTTTPDGNPHPAANLFGVGVAMSPDGNTLVVGGGEGKTLYLYQYLNNNWQLQHIFTNTHPRASAAEWFGARLALSNDGNTLIAGTPRAAYKPTDTDTSTAGAFAGMVWVWQRTIAENGEATWGEEPTRLQPQYVAERYYFGQQLALSADGTVLAVGAYGDCSAALGIAPRGELQARQSTENGLPCRTGAVYLYQRNSPQDPFTLHDYLKSDYRPESQPERFGHGLAMNASGTVLAVGAIYDRTSTGGINPQPGAGTLSGAGAVYLYQRHDTAAVWQRQAYIKALQPQQNHEFGFAVALDASGTRLAVSEQFASNSLTGIRSSAEVVNPPTIGQNGAVHVYRQQGSEWQLSGYLRDYHTEYKHGGWGASLQFSADGSVLALGSSTDRNPTNGISWLGCGSGCEGGKDIQDQSLGEGDEPGADAYGSGAIMLY